ncbi:MAG TPA: DUF4169 family protein [Sphingomonas sp.]|uniref:DUF4169 family protein n=1 Tax=Sphingomonas sp. TaxID=28214 RepID=UPI002C3824BA|nr:DUF4169 family protein [Sphingomonas sp.]HMI18314.1 DUF4169 family protein [Sphingomonas sp.]
MGDVINLRQARKARDRKAAEQAAAEARALHGRTKGQKAVEKAELERLTKTVEQSRIERGESEPN